MRKIFLTIMCLIIFSVVTFAEKVQPENDFETREIQLICALSSIAAYSNDESFLVRSNLSSRGWKVNPVTVDKNGVKTKGYLIGKTFYDGRTVKIFVISGTEYLKDVEVDFRLGGVNLHEDNLDGIFVHKGFRDYADAALSDGIAEFLIDELKNNPNETLYLTGHSLGGSVSIVMAIRLSDMGIDKNRMQVITFGALAVGNKNLADYYSDKINLTRIEVKGDIVKKMFEPFGYVQFGDVLKWKPDRSVDDYEHKMSMYLDCALRNYFDAEGFYFDDNIGENKIDVPIYVAPIKFVGENFNNKDEKYIYGILRTGLTAHMSALTFDEKNYIEVNDADEISKGIIPLIERAKNFGCKYILVQLINAARVRDAQDNERQVMLYEMLCDLNGMPILMQTSGMSTKDLSLIEAAALAQENLHNKLETALSDKNS